MIVLVTMPCGEVVSVAVSANAEAKEVRARVSALTGIPAPELGLRLGGRIVRDTDTFGRDADTESECNWAAVDAVLAVRGGVRNKCGVEECKRKPALVVGDCRYCGGHYCSEHRLPEVHSCSGLGDCKKGAYDKNADKLLHEKCVSSKV